MKTFCFTVDDNIRFLKELTLNERDSLFDHPYMAMFRRLHVRYGLKVQLNLFYRAEGFDLSQMTARYREQWQENAHWLKLSFHSDVENEWPYSEAPYEEVFRDCAAVQRQILRFASEGSLAKTTTVHYCSTTREGVRALKDNGVKGLLGLFGDGAHPCSSYSLSETAADEIRSGKILVDDGMAFAPIDLVINTVSCEEGKGHVEKLLHRDRLWLMIHEQYFYEDYIAYQPDFEEKLTVLISMLRDRGYESLFFEEMLAADGGDLCLL